MLESEFSLADAMKSAARSIGSPQSQEAMLSAITHAAADAIPGVDHASISIVNRHRQLEVLVPTDQFVADADRLQCEVGEGPCLDAALGTPVVRSDDIAREVRWPKYSPRAADMGVGAQMAMHLYDHNQSLGGLNLYFNKPRSISADSADIAGLFATHAAIVMGHARELETLTKALSTRKVIGAAIGIIMERYELDEDSAFRFLIRMSQTNNVKLRRVAEEIVAHANLKSKNQLN